MHLRPVKLVKLAIVAVGIAGFVWVCAARLPRSQGKGALMAGLVPLSLVYLAAEWYDNRQRRRLIVARLADLGFLEDEPNFHESEVHYTPERGHRGFEVKLFAEAEWQGRRARVAEFQFRTGGRRNSQAWKSFQAAVECPDAWPALELLPTPGSFSMMPDRAYKRGQKLGEGGFARRWRVAAPDLEAADAVLTPELRSWLEGASWRERWCIRDGWLSCTRLGTADERRAEALLARAAAFLARAGRRAVAA